MTGSTARRAGRERAGSRDPADLGGGGGRRNRCLGEAGFGHGAAEARKEVAIMRRELTWVAALVAGSLALACGKAPAQVALKAADAAIEAARPEVERYAPQEFKALADLSRAAHDKFNQGDYKGALADAEALPARVKAGLAAAQARKEDLARASPHRQPTLPAMLATATTRRARPSTTTKLPPPVHHPNLPQAQTESD